MICIIFLFIHFYFIFFWGGVSGQAGVQGGEPGHQDQDLAGGSPRGSKCSKAKFIKPRNVLSVFGRSCLMQSVPHLHVF